MNEQANLSPQGQSRRANMLGELQLDLESHQARLRRKRFQRRWLLGSAALLAVAVVGWWSISTLFTNTANRLQPDVANNNSDPSRNYETPTGPVFKYSIVENNRPDILDRRLVSSFQPQTEFESLADDELLSLLEQSGQPAVLGLIGGQPTIIPTSMVSRR